LAISVQRRFPARRRVSQLPVRPQPRVGLSLQL